MKRIATCAVALVLTGIGSGANGSVIHNGGEFSLSLLGQSSSTYEFRYTADFSGWLGGSQEYIAAVNWKPDTGMKPDTFSLLSTTAPGSWTTTLETASANGCDGGAESFICSEADTLTQAATSGLYQWDYSVTYPSALGESAFSDAPIRAWFVDGQGNNAGLMSLNTDIPREEVPVPGVLGLLGIGLLGLFAVTRGRRV